MIINFVFLLHTVHKKPLRELEIAAICQDALQVCATLFMLVCSSIFLIDIESVIMFFFFFFFFTFCRDLDIYTEMDEFTEMLKVSHLKRFASVFLPLCLLVALTVDLLCDFSFVEEVDLSFFFLQCSWKCPLD